MANLYIIEQQSILRKTGDRLQAEQMARCIKDGTLYRPMAVP